ncbi:J domain-containing protein [Dokdonella sp.]|uniref:J domain-containing protein n=1 Tax=Dokdonella sp. TaxID=2291710 RepID=UPI003528B2BB
MAGNTDFIALYQELEVSAGCTLEEFKHAYRKRVGALHPDREGSHARAPQDLQRLNALYASAMEFHRRHGRLPGAAQLGPISGTPGPMPTQQAAQQVHMQEPAESRGNSRIVLAFVVLVVIGLWIGANFAPAEDPDPAASLPAAEGPQQSKPGPPVVSIIDLGVTAQQVRDIQGEPVSGWEQRWEYGPSWVAFRCGVVIDWYSSTLRPLKVASEHPPAKANWSPPRNCKE